MKKKNKTLVFIPTYNERENVKKLCLDILGLKLNVDILFLDDNSPDGTGKILDSLAAIYPNVNIIHRPSKLGIGSAHINGINWAYKHQYTTLITMDCDYSHLPEYIPDLIENSKNYEVTVGSRYILKESLKEWNLYRKTLTKLGHLITKTCLRLGYDATGAYRLYRLDRIPQQVFSLIHSEGYSFFLESMYVFHVNKFRIKEVPILSPARTYGHSKMNIKDILISIYRLVQIYLTSLISTSKYKVRKPYLQLTATPKIEKDLGWDEYWLRQKSTSGRVYSRIADFYRKYIIKKCLNHFIEKYFSPQSQVLHAGCGSGQVDTDISEKLSITALDISIPALKMYKQINKDSCKVIHGTIFAIPLKDETMDGIYNLGVMEHFTEEEIHQALTEFNRVLKPKGKAILFWPPKFGLSVNVLLIVHYILNNIFKKRIRLHPRELSLIRSKKHAEDIFKKANLTLKKYYFGVRDLFTHSINVVEKGEERNYR